MSSRRSIWALALLPLLSACPIGDLTSESDAANDAATDAAIDAATDASAEATPPSDGPIDAPLDSSQPTITFVQETDGYFSSAGLTFNSAVSDGSSVIVVVDNHSIGAAPLSDTAGNNYTVLVNAYASSAGDVISIYAAFDMKGGITNIKVALPDAGAGYIYYAAEYRGITTFDAKAFGSSTSTVTDGLATTNVNVTHSPELLFAYAESLQNLHSGTNFDARSIFDGNTIEDRIVTVLSSYDATATSFGGAGDIVLVTFH